MWRLLATSLFLLCLAYGDEEFEKEDGVYALTDKNFDDYAKANPTFLTLFYAPGCYHCKQFLPVYAKVARQVEIPLVKVNVEVEKELAKRYEIKGYPTLKLWKDSEGPQEFDGIGMELDEVVEWVRSKTDPNYTPPPEAVVTLTAANFTAFVSEQALCLVEFYAPWCGHCKNLAPQYEKAARKLRDQGSHIKLIKVNAEAEKELAQQYGVSGFPTLLVMRHGRRSEYKGSRDANGIINHMKDLAKPAAKKLDNASAIDRFMEKEDVTIVAFFASEDSTTFEAFSEAAEMLREDFKSMGYTTDSKAFKKFEAKPNDIIIFYPTIFQSKFEPKSRTFNKPGATPEELTAFFRDHCTPLVGKRTKDNIATRYTKFPLVVVYYNADFSLQYREGSEYWRQKVLNVAQKYQKDKYRFAVADEEEFEDELKNVGLGDSGLEHNVVAFGYDGKKYVMDPNEFDGDFDENLEEFMKKLSSGKVKAFVKSAPVPRDDKGPVRTLVASNFDKIVGDESKDVLIEFYAPWCGHCKTFEPKYKELATNLKKTQPNLIIAKFDATANDAPPAFVVSGFPTIYFAPSGKKSTPIKYDGDRDLEEITKFMELHALKSFQKKEDSKKEEL